MYLSLFISVSTEPLQPSTISWDELPLSYVVYCNLKDKKSRQMHELMFFWPAWPGREYCLEIFVKNLSETNTRETCIPIPTKN